VLSETEVFSRYEIKMEGYLKDLNIEGRTAVDMINKQILPAALKYKAKLASCAQAVKELDPQASLEYEKASIGKIGELSGKLYEGAGALSALLEEVGEKDSIEAKVNFAREAIFAKLAEVRTYADELELIVAKEDWPFPTYGDLLLY
jgi:glutamine synthetase